MTVSSISYPTGFTGNWSGGTIAASGSRTVTVTFIPTAAISYGGTVTVSSDKTSGTNTLSISGTGTSVTRIIGLSSSLAFSNVNVNSTKQLSYTITNSGNSSLTVSSITYPTGFTGNWSGRKHCGKRFTVRYRDLFNRCRTVI
ncbi:MAG: choice-of-anchor D domain-containing protein [Desulfobacterales bacterium]